MQKTALLLPILFLFGSSLCAQIIYEPGYYIDKNGKKEEVLILNKDWRSSPSNFSYKYSEEGEVQNGNINNVLEFGIGDFLRYKSFIAPMDKSEDRVSQMSTEREPNFKYERVFLQQLIAGKASLYMYTESGAKRFFYTLNGGDLEPLVYKKYKKENKIATNRRFRQQLFTNLNCEAIPAADFTNIEYSRKDMQDYFIRYNECEGADFYMIREDAKGTEINLYLKSGIEYGGLSIMSGMNASGTEIDFKPGVRIGTEAELILPFNRDKWSLFGEALYGSYHIEDEHIQSDVPIASTQTWLSMDLEFISLGGGVRHYFFLSETSKLFVNGAITFDIPLQSEVVFERGENYEMDAELDDPATDAYFTLGLGYNYSNRLSAELRYNLPKVTHGRNSVPTHFNLEWKAEITSLSLILAYRIL